MRPPAADQQYASGESYLCVRARSSSPSPPAPAATTTAAVETGNANLARAKERYAAARLGPTKEERAIADAKVEAAAAAVAVIAARVAKLRVYAPVDGAVALLVAETGEAIVPGQPLMTLHKAGEHWASFNLR